MTCIGNSGPLAEPIVEAIEKVSLTGCMRICMYIYVYAFVCRYVCTYKDLKFDIRTFVNKMLQRFKALVTSFLYLCTSCLSFLILFDKFEILVNLSQ